MAYFCEVVSSSSESNFRGDESAQPTPMCQACDLTFVDQQALTQHLKNPVHPCYCRPCQRYFGSFAARRQHWQDSPQHKHTYCDRCDINFPSHILKLEHIRNMNSNHFLCEPCYVDYYSSEDLKQHFVSSPIHDGTYCCKCERDFSNQNNLREVLLSKLRMTFSSVTDKFLASESTHAERPQLLGMWQ